MIHILTFHVLVLTASAIIVCIGYVVGQQMPYPHFLCFTAPGSDAAVLSGSPSKYINIRALQVVMLVLWAAVLCLFITTGTPVTSFTLMTFGIMTIGHCSVGMWIHLLLKNMGPLPPVAVRPGLSRQASQAPRQDSIPMDEAILVVVLQPDFEEKLDKDDTQDPDWLWTQHKGVSLGYAITHEHVKRPPTHTTSKSGMLEPILDVVNQADNNNAPTNATASQDSPPDDTSVHSPSHHHAHTSPFAEAAAATSAAVSGQVMLGVQGEGTSQAQDAFHTGDGVDEARQHVDASGHADNGENDHANSGEDARV